jgi:hypothetical protein
MIELTLRFIDDGFRLSIERMIGDRNIWIAVKLGELDLGLLLQGEKLGLIQLQCVARLVIGFAGDAIAGD